MRLKYLKILGLMFIGLVGCYDYSKFDNISIEPISPTFVFPVLNDSITIKDILEKNDSLDIQENPDKSISIIFKDTIDAGFATDQFDIPDQTFDTSLTLPALPLNIVLTAGVEYNFSYKYYESIETTTEAGSTIKLKEIDFSAGTFRVHLVNNFQHTVAGKITLSSLLKNDTNDTCRVSFSFTTQGEIKDTLINLNQYHFDALNEAENLYNTFSYKINGKLTTQNHSVSAGDGVSIQLIVTSPVFSRITGDINYTFDQPNQSTNVDFSQSSLDIQHHLEDPKIKLGFINSYGIPMSVSFPQFQLNNKDNVPFNLLGNGNDASDLQIGSGVPNVIVPIATPGQQPVTTNFVLNRDNSNIENAFDVTPTSINYGASFTVGDNSGNDNYFVDQSSTVKLTTEVEIPIYGYISVSLDTLMDNNLTPLDSIDGIDVSDVNITLTLKIYNQVPFNIYLQATFLDDALVEQTKLFEGVVDQQLIASPNVGSDGISTNTAYKKTPIPISKAKYDLMSKATKMLLKFRFALGSNTQSAKVLSTNSMRIQASVKIEGTLKPKL